MSDSDASSRGEFVLRVFAEFLARTETDDTHTVDELCNEHPEIADDLRALIRIQGGVTDQARGFLFKGNIALRVLATGLVERLSRHGVDDRYGDKQEIGRGGMGLIFRVWDKELRRHLAMKVIRSGPDESSRERALARFLEEAQVTSQLDHPGVVPVHELGIDSEGTAYFTMKLVKGEDLDTIFTRLHSGDSDWTIARALRVVLGICEALAYAHDKGVVHRDLKPSNVMVGKYGEVYVMDWGLARVVGAKELHDVRLRTSTATIHTDREEARSDDSPLMTMDGVVVGTPAYMSPEQARGETDRLDGRSDTYAVGAMLYHLLTGLMPFVPKSTNPTPHTVLARVLDGPPQPNAISLPHARWGPTEGAAGMSAGETFGADASSHERE